jgi:pimeloyl-ACP methyl ester carboxylesterase
MGGYVALALWRLYPDRVRALILCDTRATADSPEARTKRDALIARAVAEGAHAVADLQLPVTIGQATRERSPHTVDAARTILERQSVAGIVAGIRLMRDRPDQTAALATITVPTLVLCGAEDVLTPPAEMEPMAAKIPGAIFSRVPLTGHLVPFEQPAVFVAAVSTFLAQVEG